MSDIAWIKRIVMFALVVASPLMWAAQPNPPTVNCDPSDCVETDDPQTPNTPGYDLSGFDIPFNYNWPALPETNQEINVAAGDIGSLRSAVATPGARVIVPAGTYNGSVTDFANNVDLVMNNNATIVGRIEIANANTIRWTGGNLVANGSEAVILFASSDITFDNVNIETNQQGSASNEGIALRRGLSRFAFLNSTMDFTDDNGWALHTNSNGEYVDVILANVKVYGDSTGATYRFNPVTRLIVVDSYMDARGNNTAMRASGATDIFWQNIVNVGALHTGFSNASSFTFDLNGLTARNVHIYKGNNIFIQPGSLGFGTVYDSAVHNSAGAGSPTLSPMTDGGGNRGFGWDGRTIDYSYMPGKSSPDDYGADH